MGLELIEIGQQGQLPESIVLNNHLRMVVEMTVQHFEKQGYNPPWIGYAAVENSVPVGTCAFKRPPLGETTDLETFAERAERVKVRNKIASKIMTEQHIPTDNLFELVKDHAEWTSGDGVHFNGQGNEALAK